MLKILEKMLKILEKMFLKAGYIERIPDTLVKTFGFTYPYIRDTPNFAYSPLPFSKHFFWLSPGTVYLFRSNIGCLRSPTKLA